MGTTYEVVSSGHEGALGGSLERDDTKRLSQVVRPETTPVSLLFLAVCSPSGPERPPLLASPSTIKFLISSNRGCIY